MMVVCKNKFRKILFHCGGVWEFLDGRMVGSIFFIRSGGKGRPMKILKRDIKR
jgi:hypothetical protein